MHQQAYDWVAQWATDEPVAVLDIGGRDINGTVRDLFPNADPYVSLDLFPGSGVDIVTDAARWTPDRKYDVVVCCEVFEHTPAWPDICRTAFAALRVGGLFVATMAGTRRPTHSGVDGGAVLHPGEHYRGVGSADLSELLDQVGFDQVKVREARLPHDVYATAVRPPSVDAELWADESLWTKVTIEPVRPGDPEHGEYRYSAVGEGGSSKSTADPVEGAKANGLIAGAVTYLLDSNPSVLTHGQQFRVRVHHPNTSAT